MVKDWQKRLDRLDRNTSKMLEKVIEDIINLNLEGYDIKKLEGFSNSYRIRKGKIRIVFSKLSQKGVIELINYRGDVYKGI